MKLEQVLADQREAAAVLRANGHGAQATSIERVCDAVQAACPLYLEWLSEREAMLRSGKGIDYFRTRFGAWLRDGMAEMRGRNRYYRGVVVPTRVLDSLVRAEARRETA